jgi:hypothetical protein
MLYIRRADWISAARHLRCTYAWYLEKDRTHISSLIGDTKTPACDNCRYAGEACERFLNIRFRNGLDFIKDQDVTFLEKAAWPSLTGPSRSISLFFGSISDLDVQSPILR